jgi:D-serine deaminase-like pyridoxal phosphate-dependent protein
MHLDPQEILAARHKKAPAVSSKGAYSLPPFCQTIASAAAQQARVLVAVEAGAIINLAPHCPRWASRRVDQLTLTRDRLLGVEVVL